MLSRLSRSLSDVGGSGFAPGAGPVALGFPRSIRGPAEPLGVSGRPGAGTPEPFATGARAVGPARGGKLDAGATWAASVDAAECVGMAAGCAGIADAACVGATLGAAVGAATAVARTAGSTVGVDVGCRVGNGVGASVGAVLGADDGKALAAGVGARVGVTVGMAVGASVGAAVGARVGTAVGASVGTAVGASVGTIVATAVGAGVGKWVGVNGGAPSAVGADVGVGFGEGSGGGATPTIAWIAGTARACGSACSTFLANSGRRAGALDLATRGRIGTGAESDDATGLDRIAVAVTTRADGVGVGFALAATGGCGDGVEDGAAG